MTLTSNGIAYLREIRRWFRRRVLQQRSWMDGSPYSHEKALLDKIRCDAYQKAIQRTVKPGDVVVDLGAGTGLLSSRYKPGRAASIRLSRAASPTWPLN